MAPGHAKALTLPVLLVLWWCCRDTLLHGQPMRRPSIKSMDIPHGMRTVVEQECNTSQVRLQPLERLSWTKVLSTMVAFFATLRSSNAFG